MFFNEDFNNVFGIDKAKKNKKNNSNIAFVSI